MQITLTLPPALQNQLFQDAQQQHLNLHDYIIQCLLKNTNVDKQPNSITQQTIEDARQGKNMQKIALSELKQIACRAGERSDPAAFHINLLL